jgi:hypothetical protein
MTLEQKLIPLRLRYKQANDMEKRAILRAVAQYRKEYGVQDSKPLFDETFSDALKVFGEGS